MTTRFEVAPLIAAEPATIFDVLRDPHGHVAIDSSGMLMQATGEPVETVGDRFTVHMDREALGDRPLGRYDVDVVITVYEPDREIAWTIEGQARPYIGHVYGYRLEPVEDGTRVTSYYDWSRHPPRVGRARHLPGHPRAGAARDAGHPRPHRRPREARPAPEPSQPAAAVEGCSHALRLQDLPAATTWDDMLAVWRAADEIELFESRLDLRPLLTDLQRPLRPLPGRLGDAHRAGPGDEPAARRRARDRHALPAPAVLANMAATLDIISDGRLELGLGAGWNTEEADAYGIDRSAPRRAHATASTRRATCSSCAAHQGRRPSRARYFQLDGAFCEPKPVQRPHPPICIGGSGEKRTLPTVARLRPALELHRRAGGRVRAAQGRARRALRRVRARPRRDHDVGPPPPRPRRPAALAAQADEFAEAGLDLGIVYLPPPHSPADLETVAEVVAGI